MLSILGNIASIVGLALTILVFLNTKKIKEYYLLRARVPELIDKLTECSSKLAEQHREFEESRDLISVELGRAEVVLKSLEAKLKGRGRDSVRSLIKSVKNYDVKTQERDSLWAVYVGMTKVIDELRDLQEDLKWGN